MFCYGDLSPDSEKILPVGRIAFVDFGMSFWGPQFWEAFVLTIAPYSTDFLDPMLKAFERRGLRIEPKVGQQLNEFRTWHSVYGKAVARLLSPSFNSEWLDTDIYVQLEFREKLYSSMHKIAVSGGAHHDCKW